MTSQKDGAAYIDLLWCSEHPDSIFRRLSRDQRSPAARVVGRLLDLLADVDQLGWDADNLEVVECVHRLSDDDIQSLGAALQAVGGHRALRWLSQLVGHLWGVSGDQQIDTETALARLEMRPGLQRALGRSMEACQDLLAPISRYARAHRLDQGLTEQRPANRPAPDVTLPPMRSRDPGAPRFTIMRWGGRQSVTLIAAWLAKQGGGVHFTGSGDQRINIANGAADLRHLGQWSFGIPDQEAIGVLRSGHDRPVLSLRLLVDNPVQYLETLLEAFEWALVPIMGGDREGRFAFVSRHPHLQHNFLRFAVAHSSHPRPIGFYDDPHLLGSRAQAATFGESSDYGEAALQTGGPGDALPLVGAMFTLGNGFRWRKWTAQCECLAIHRVGDGWGVQLSAVYRPPSREVFLKLWSRIGCDDSIAFLAVPSHSAPGRVLEHLTFSAQPAIEAASREFGWAYGHIWGGGADEHYAVFHAQDPEATNRVYDYAASRVEDGWWLGGRWSTPIPFPMTKGSGSFEA